MYYGLGIDISKDKFDVCLSKKIGHNTIKVVATRKFHNSIAGFKALYRWIIKKTKSDSIEQIVLEPTGVYHENLSHYLYDLGLNVCIVMAKQAKYYLKSLGNKSKTDKIDAKGLSQLACERSIELWTPPSKEIGRLRTTYRLKDMLLKDKTQTENRLHALQSSYQPDKFVVKHLKQYLNSIESRLDKIKEEIESRLETENEFNKKVHQIANSIVGISAITVGQIAAETNGFNLFSSQAQLISYCGYDIKLVQSGKFAGQEKISKQGCSRIRKALYFPAISAVTHSDGIFYKLYERVYLNTKIKMKGYVAVQRKLLTIIYTLWKNNSTFDPNYQNKHPMHAS